MWTEIYIYSYFYQKTIKYWVSAGEDEQVLEKNCNDDHTIRMYFMPQTVLKMDRMVNFMLCILYHNKKNNKASMNILTKKTIRASLNITMVDPWTMQGLGHQLPAQSKTMNNFWLPQNLSYPLVSTGDWL